MIQASFRVYYTGYGILHKNGSFGPIPQPRAAHYTRGPAGTPGHSTKVTPGLQNEQRRTKGALGSQIRARPDFTDTTRSVLCLSLRAVCGSILPERRRGIGFSVRPREACPMAGEEAMAGQWSRPFRCGDWKAQACRS